MTSVSPVARRTKTPESIGALKVLLSFPAMLAVLLATLAVISVRSRFDDPDMWWHLRIGKIIWTTHTIPATDLFSYTTNQHAYIAHEWLSQALIFGAYRFGSYSGLMLWLCFFTAALLLAGYGLCWLYSGNEKISFLGALTIWMFATIGLSVRPQMIGYLLLVVELLLIQLGITRNPRWFLGLPPLFAIWINCHGSFFLGIIVAGVFVFSSLFHFRIGLLEAMRWGAHGRSTLMWSSVLSLAALFLNPNGVKQIVYPLETLFRMPINLSQVDEWQPLQLVDARGIAFMGVIACIFLLVILRQSNLFWHELLLLALGTWMAASHLRMLFVFGILTAPILSRLLSTAWSGYDAGYDRPLLNAVCIVGSILIALWAFPGRSNLARQVDNHSPVQAVEFMETHQLSGRMLNEYVYGGYLIWAAPKYPVFIDGRADVFEQTGVLDEYGKWATLRSDPNELLDKYRIDFCLLSRKSPMAFVLPLLHRWTAVYSDKNSIIFQRAEAKTNLKR